MQRASIQITNSCNLTCPSCPLGRAQHRFMPKVQSISQEKFIQILAKLKMLPGIKANPISLHNWNEPFLHPQITELVEIINQHGMSCMASTNLNLNVNYGKAINNPAFRQLIVSVSGITQDTYQKGHRRGNINNVLRNLEKLAYDKTNADCQVQVVYHQYNDNLEEESQIKDLAQQFGFEFYPYPAFISLSHWVAQYFCTGVKAWEHDPDALQVLPRLLFSQNYIQMFKVNDLDDIPCSMQDNNIFIDVDGNVFSCCYFSFEQNNYVGNILEDDLPVLMAKKKTLAFCRQCRQAGYHLSRDLVEFLGKEIDRLSIQRQHCQINSLLHKMNLLLKNEHNILAESPPLALYGANVTGSALAGLLLKRGFRLTCFIDDNAHNIPRHSSGLEVLSLPQAAERGMLDNVLILISFVHTAQQLARIKNDLQQAGSFNAVSFDQFLESYVN